ncbi:hypothetical protein TNCV_4076531 [Trichonephila clavipes]|nr:hypothetical protein TNCV_4076531 [Trichonephila clavipes]
MTRIPYHTNQFAHRQHNGSDGIGEMTNLNIRISSTGNTRYKVYSPQFPSPYHHLPFRFSGRPYIRENNDFHNDRQFCDPMLQLSTPVKEHKTIIRYSNLIKHVNL